jgi:hypothetical protein
MHRSTLPREEAFSCLFLVGILVGRPVRQALAFDTRKPRNGLLRRRRFLQWRTDRLQSARRANQYFLSSPHAKNIPLEPSGKSGALVRASFPTEGRWPTSSTRDEDAVDAKALLDERR